MELTEQNKVKKVRRKGAGFSAQPYEFRLALHFFVPPFLLHVWKSDWIGEGEIDPRLCCVTPGLTAFKELTIILERRSKFLVTCLARVNAANAFGLTNFNNFQFTHRFFNQP